MKLYVNPGRAPDHQLLRDSADSVGKSVNLAPYVDEVLEQREIRRAFDQSPHIPIAATSTESMSRGELEADLLILGDAIALRAVDVFSKYSLLIPGRSKNP